MDFRSNQIGTKLEKNTSVYVSFTGCHGIQV